MPIFRRPEWAIDFNVSPFALGINNPVVVGRLIMLASKFRATQMAIERLKVEKDSLEYELKLYQADLVKITANHMTCQETQPCRFCASSIAASALVCKKCRRTQPAAYSEVISNDRKIQIAVTTSMSAGYTIEHFPKDFCAYCREPLNSGAIVCSTCDRMQPRSVTQVVQEDLNALTMQRKAAEKTR